MGLFSRKSEPQTAYEMVEQAVGKRKADDLRRSIMEAPTGHTRRAVADRNAERMRKDRG